MTGLAPASIAFDAQHGEIFSANYLLDTVTTHALSANGNVAPLRSITAYASAVVYDPADDQIVVSDFQVTTFERTAVGLVNPVRNLSVGSGAPGAIALTGPAHGDRMFVLDQVNRNQILVYARTDSGQTPPSAIITLSSVFATTSLAYDAATDEILVGVVRSDASGAVYAVPASASTGTTTPSRVLSGNMTGLNDPLGLAVDASGGILYVADSGAAVLTFPLAFAAIANVAPTRTLSGPATQFTGGQTKGIAFGAGKLIVQNANRVLVFDASASGNTAPLTAISSSDTGIEKPGGIAYDAAHGEITVANQGVSPSISSYARTAQGDAAPLRTLNSSNLGAYGVMDLVLDAAHDELVVAPGNISKVQIFARAASGNGAPLRTIAGANTLLQSAGGVALDPAGDAIVVNDSALARRFPRSFIDGNEAPLNSIGGSLSGLSGAPQGLAVDDGHGEILVADGSSVFVFGLTTQGNVAPSRTLTPYCQRQSQSDSI